jgi:hypothetical protein
MKSVDRRDYRGDAQTIEAGADDGLAGRPADASVAGRIGIVPAGTIVRRRRRGDRSCSDSDRCPAIPGAAGDVRPTPDADSSDTGVAAAGKAAAFKAAAANV